MNLNSLTYLAQVKHLTLYSGKMCRFVLLKNALKTRRILPMKSDRTPSALCKVAAIVGIVHDVEFNAQSTNTGVWCKGARNCLKIINCGLSRSHAVGKRCQKMKQTLVMESGRIHYSPDGVHTVRVTVKNGIMRKSPNVKSVVTRTATYSRHFRRLTWLWARNLSTRPITQGAAYARWFRPYFQPMYGVQLWASDLEISTTFLGWKVSRVRADTWRNISLKTLSLTPAGHPAGDGLDTRNLSLNFPTGRQTLLY